MKIGINASFLRKQNTGIGQVTANFLKKLAELPNGKEMEFVLYLEEETDLELPDNFSKKIFLPLWKRDDLIRKIWWEKCLLPKMIKKDGCELLFSLYQCPTILPEKQKIKHMMLAHDVIPEIMPVYLNNWRKKLYWILTKQALKKADKIIAVSKHTEKDLANKLRLDPRKISVVYVATDEIYQKEVSEQETERVLEKYQLKPGYIYHGGGLDLRKNTERLMRAYENLIKNYGMYFEIPPLVISGKMQPQMAPLIVDVANLRAALGLEEKVILLDFVTQKDLPALYKSAKVFVYPSLYEGFGLPVLEAMEQGTPVITSKRSSLPEIAGDAALYCNAEDIDDLTMVLKNFLTNPALGEKLAQRGKERVTKFSWNNFTERILNIIKERQF